MKPKIDNLDREIFDCLREEARMPASEIARRLGHITARAVRNRIDRLVDEGFISITAGAVPERLGFPISADIYIDVEPGEIEHVANKMAELDEVFYVAMTTGDTDISASTVAVSMAALQEFISTKLHTIPGVTKTKTYVLTKILKQSCDWPFPDELPKV
jgi:Lrp/AsnC family transcriptional regulator for asnA, asnC and gidA